MGVKNFHHICIQTNCYQESVDFYVRGFGFSVVKETPDFHSREYNTWLRLGEFFIELQTPKRGEVLQKWSSMNSGPVHLAFTVDDVHQEYERLRSMGFTDFKIKDGREVYEVEDGYLFKIKAPEGTEIEVRAEGEI